MDVKSSLLKSIRDDILGVHLRDNVQARVLMPEGAYKRIVAQPGEEEINSQLWMVQHRGLWNVGE